MAVIEKTMDELVQERQQIIKQTDACWFNGCETCTKVDDAIESGQLKHTTLKTTKNEICEACPIHKEIQAHGKRLERNLKETQQKRKEDRKRRTNAFKRYPN